MYRKLILLILTLPPVFVCSQIIDLSDNLSTSLNPRIINHGDYKYVFWNDGESQNRDIYFKRQIYDSWSDVTIIQTNNKSRLYSICSGSSDKIHLLWTETLEYSNRLMYGELFESALIDSVEIVSYDSLTIDFSSLYVDTINNELHISWDVSNWDTVFTLYSFRDNQGIWSDKRLLMKNEYNHKSPQAQLIKDKNNDILCYWWNVDSLSIDCLKKHDENNWVEGVRLTDEMSGVGYDFLVKADDSLNIHLVTHPGIFLTCPCSCLLYAKWDGLQWFDIESVPANDKYFGRYVEHDNPDISFSLDNYPVIAWNQNGYNDYLRLTKTCIGTAVKSDTGWHVNRYLAERREPKFPKVLVDNNDLIHFVWQDTSDGDYDVYYSTTQLLTSVKNYFEEYNTKTFQLYQNYPNPFNCSTKIKFYLQQKSQIKLTIFNILGDKIRTLYKGSKSAGISEFIWDGKNDLSQEIAAGIYFYKINIVSNNCENIVSKKMIYLK